jgi:large subunit ribosomal protein L4
MAVVDVINTKAEKVSQLELNDAIYAVAVKTSVLHEVVTMQLAARRAGTAAVKGRSDVRGSGKKLFRQKGTGRARRGDVKAPLLRGGGVVFGPEPRSYERRVPKKIKRLALKMALSVKLKDDALMVLQPFELERIKTRDMVAVLDNLKLESALIVTAGDDEKLALSTRNIPAVKVLRCEGLNVYDILKYEKLVLLESTLERIEGRLSA